MTILITSIALLSIASIPNNAFAEVPSDCLADFGSIGGIISVTPGKASDNTDIFVTFSVTSPDLADENTSGSCDGLIGLFGDPDILVNNVPVNCPVDNNLLPILIQNGETKKLWGSSSVFGTCEISGNLVNGVNSIRGDSQTGQFNIDLCDDIDNPACALPQGSSNTVQKTFFDACIDVEKTGPIKVLLEETAPDSGIFETVVTYTVKTTNCSDQFDTGTTLSNCSLDDTIAGQPQVVIPPLLPGEEAVVQYDVTIDGPTDNTATVTCEDQLGFTHFDLDTHFVETYTAGITVEKIVPPKLPADSTFDYEIRVTNDGSSTIFDCTIDDQTLGFFDDESCTSIGSEETCTVTIPGPICTEAPPENTVTVVCLDQEQQPVTGFATAEAPRCAAFSVDIKKECDPKVTAVPGLETDPINCTITIENDGPDTLTNCSVVDSLTGDLQFPSTLNPGDIFSEDTATPVTPEMIEAGIVTNTATIVCDTQDGFDPATAEATDNIDIFSVDATVVKECEPPTQLELGSIDWSWTVTNTSPDGVSSLDVECSGVSTINNPELEDALDAVISFGGSESNLWTTSGLDDGTYENTILCTFTEQGGKSFQVEATASCEVEPVRDFNGCTPGYWKANYDNREAVNWFDGANPDKLITDVFSSADGDLDGIAGPDTLRDALNYKGGKGLEGAERNLLRQATAAYLNIGTDAFDYEFGSIQELKDAVNAAIDSGDRSQMLNLASILDGFNNAVDDEGVHCPLSNSIHLLE